LKDRKSEQEQQIEQLEETIQSLERRERELSSSLSEIGISFEEPRELFEKEHDLNKQFEEAVLDRVAGAFSLEVIDRLEGDYLTEIRRLLSSDDSSTGSGINELYRSVMGDDHEIRFDVDELGFEVVTGGETIPESALSSGARAHLYLSCRLAVLRRLFGGTPGFVILDDPFLHYFPSRKERVMDPLKTLVDEGWQLLLFTVDPQSRNLFRDRLGASVHSVEDLYDSDDTKE